MPLVSFDITTAVKFAFTRTQTDWGDVQQGDNAVQSNLRDLDVSVWKQAFAERFAVAGGATIVKDVHSFTNLAFESVTLTKALALVVLVELDDPADTDVTITMGPSGGSDVSWFYGSDGVTLVGGDTLVKSAATNGTGIVIDGTHKNIQFANAGADDAHVTLVILGRIT